jgi:hypothetical protein
MIKYGNGTNSTMGSQFNAYEYKRKALIETAQVEFVPLPYLIILFPFTLV